VETGNAALTLQFELIDPSLEVTDPSDCHLAIYVSSTLLVFTLLRKATFKYVLLASYIGHIDAENPENLDVLDQLTGDFESISVALDFSPTTLMPAALYDDGIPEQAQKLLFSERHALKIERIESGDLVLLYPETPQLEKLFLKRFPNAIIHHQDWFRLESDLTRFIKSIQPLLLVTKGGHQMHILILKGREVLVNNRFEVNGAESVAYFILNAIQTVGLEAGDIKCIFRGTFEKGSEEVLLVSKYLGNIHFDAPPDQLKYSHEFGNIPLHHFAELFYHCTCVS
jgi:hypothetical protein